MASVATASDTSLIYVIEHMETEISPWVRNEYTRMMQDVGAANLMFTNMKPNVNCSNYDDESMSFLSKSKLISETFQEFHDAIDGDRTRAVLLDERSESLLSPDDAGTFQYFLFGGILGNVDELDMDKTKELRIQGYTLRHLGKEQMTTPTALAVTHQILSKKIQFDDINFIDRPEYEVNDSETLVIPFRYIANDQGEAIMAEGNLELMSNNLEWDIDMLM